MATKTKIAWAAMPNADGTTTPGATWTPIQAVRKDTGKCGCACVKISPGCKLCYSETMQLRNLPSHGTGLEFTVLNMEKVDIVINEEILLQPLKWKKPRMIFVCSQTDLFGEFVSDAQIDRVFWAMAWNQRHTHQVLTKRADRMLAYCAGMAALTPQQRAIRMVNSGRFFNLPADTPTSGVPWPLPNVWLGVSVENQEWADKRIPDLLRTQAAKRFISAEPLLGPVSLGRWTEEGIECSQCKWFGVEEQARRVDDPVDDWWYACPKCGEICAHTPGDELLGEGINWVIVGGESGHGARQCRVEWIESIRDQCKEWGVACFVKQLGAYPIWAGAKCLPIEPARGKCDNPLEWPESLRVQQFPL